MHLSCASALPATRSSEKTSSPKTSSERLAATTLSTLSKTAACRRLRMIAALMVVVSLGILVGNSQSAEPNVTPVPAESRFASSIRAEAVRPHIEYLAGPELNGRSGADALRAAEYVQAHFQECGLSPLFAEQSYFQEILGTGNEGEPRAILGRNVGAWLPGSDPELRDEFVIVSAHYDHLGIRNNRIYAGADDNASGVSMVLELAREYTKAGRRPRRSIVFLAFDLEERMLWGSRWFVAHSPWPLDRVKLFITADMIGRSLGNLPLRTVFVLGSEYAPGLQQTLNEVGQPENVSVARMGIDLLGALPRSDYGPFRSHKVPFLFFSTGEHPDYHTPRDTPEKIDYEQVAAVSGLILKVTRSVADAVETPIWTDDVRPDLGEVHALNRIATLLMQADSGKQLGSFQRFVVSHAETKTRQIIERGVITPAERTWLIRVAQALLLSVF